jgi:hypothetical protein
MKLLHRLSIALFLLTPVGYAEAAKWTNLMSATDLAYEVDTDSVSKDSLGYVEYLTRTTWKAPAPLPGATRPVAVAVTRYQMDCEKKQWRVLDGHYHAVDGSSAGVYSPPNADWAAIAPGTVVDAVFRQFC